MAACWRNGCTHYPLTQHCEEHYLTKSRVPMAACWGNNCARCLLTQNCEEHYQTKTKQSAGGCMLGKRPHTLTSHPTLRGTLPNEDQTECRWLPVSTLCPQPVTPKLAGVKLIDVTKVSRIAFACSQEPSDKLFPRHFNRSMASFVCHVTRETCATKL